MIFSNKFTIDFYICDLLLNTSIKVSNFMNYDVARSNCLSENTSELKEETYSINFLEDNALYVTCNSFLLSVIFLSKKL